MAEQQSGLSEAAGVGTAVSDLFKLKQAVPFAKAVKGGVGGAAGAAIGMALEHKEGIKKSAAAITAALMLPVLFLTMLPGLTFGNLSENSGVLNSGTLINENLQKANQAIVEVLMECHDEVLAEIIAGMKALPNVREIQEQGQTLETLREMGIIPRAAFLEKNPCILTNLREDESGKYLFVYQFMYTKQEPSDVTLSVEGIGRPWRLDCWSGEIGQIPDYRQHMGRTELKLHLQPGEACMIYLEHSSQEEKPQDSRPSEWDVPEPVRLRQWDLVVEDWNEGRKVSILENRGLGIETEEVYYETSKERIHVPETDLRPWCEIPQIGPEVSGVGYYTANAVLSEEWVGACGTVLALGSTNGNTAAVYVNGKKAGIYLIQFKK